MRREWSHGRRPPETHGHWPPLPLRDLGRFSPAEPAAGTLRTVALLPGPGPQPAVPPAAPPKGLRISVGVWYERHERPRVARPRHTPARPGVLPAESAPSREAKAATGQELVLCWDWEPTSPQGRMAASGNSVWGRSGCQGFGAKCTPGLLEERQRGTGVRAGGTGRWRDTELSGGRADRPSAIGGAERGCLPITFSPLRCSGSWAQPTFPRWGNA